jgi:hypothetical protein
LQNVQPFQNQITHLIDAQNDPYNGQKGENRNRRLERVLFYPVPLIVKNERQKDSDVDLANYAAFAVHGVHLHWNFSKRERDNRQYRQQDVISDRQHKQPKQSERDNKRKEEKNPLRRFEWRRGVIDWRDEQELFHQRRLHAGSLDLRFYRRRSETPAAGPGALVL